MYIAVNPRVFGVMFPLNSMCSQKSSFISRLLYSTYVGDDCVTLTWGLLEDPDIGKYYFLLTHSTAST